MFYRSTIRELFREFVAARRRLVDDENARITQAWHVVRIYAKALHDKRVPKLAPLLIDGAQGREQTPEQMKVMLKMIAAKYGLTLRHRG